MLTAFASHDATLRRTSEQLADALWIDLFAPSAEEADSVAKMTGM